MKRRKLLSPTIAKSISTSVLSAGRFMGLHEHSCESKKVKKNNENPLQFGFVIGPPVPYPHPAPFYRIVAFFVAIRVRYIHKFARL